MLCRMISRSVQCTLCECGWVGGKGGREGGVQLSDPLLEARRLGVAICVGVQCYNSVARILVCILVLNGSRQ